MFWIGLIIGIPVGALLLLIFALLASAKMTTHYEEIWSK